LAAENIWNLTASQPASAAASISRKQFSSFPLWFIPISAMM